MIKKLILVLTSLILISVSIRPTQAQKARTQTFSASDKSYSLKYLAAWSASPKQQVGGLVAFSAPQLIIAEAFASAQSVATRFNQFDPSGKAWDVG